MKISEERLFDFLIIHQLYLEGLKAGTKHLYKDYLKSLKKELMVLIYNVRGENLGHLTNKQIRSMMSKIKSIQSMLYSSYLEDIEKELQKIQKADFRAIATIYAKLEKEEKSGEVEQKEIMSEAGAENWLTSKKEEYSDEKDEESEIIPIPLWASIFKTMLIPATGLSIYGVLNNHQKSSLNSLIKTFGSSIADNDKKSQLIGKLFGDDENAGVLKKFDKWNTTEINTMIQSITVNNQAAIESAFFNQYVWFSVIDAVTTDICRGRNRKVYVYGKGPKPPAHDNCRSKIYPLVGKNIPTFKTLYQWLKGSDPGIQNYLLGKENANLFRKSMISPEDLRSFFKSSPLTLEGFLAKLNSALMS